MKERLKFNYETSKDYDKLFELIQKQRVVCFVTYKIGDTEVTDICASSVNGIEHNTIHIGARGIGYITAMNIFDKTIKEDFMEQCNMYKLEYATIQNIKNGKYR